MFTVPNAGGPFVSDGVTFVTFKHLLGVGATQATATGQLNTDGTSTLDTTPVDPNWYNPTTGGVGSSYWVRATLLSGDTPNGGDVLNAWLALSAARVWSWTTTGGGTIRQRTGQLKLEFSPDAGGAVILGTNTMQGNALVDNS